MVIVVVVVEVEIVVVVVVVIVVAAYFMTCNKSKKAANTYTLFIV